MRHTDTYDSVDMISDTEADAVMKLAEELGQQVTVWLKENHAQLLERQE